MDVRKNSEAINSNERSKAIKSSKKVQNIKENPAGKSFQKYQVPKHTIPDNLMHSGLSNIDESESLGTPFSLDDDSSSSSDSNSTSRKANKMYTTGSMRNKKKVTNIKR